MKQALPTAAESVSAPSRFSSAPDREALVSTLSLFKMASFGDLSICERLDKDSDLQETDELICKAVALGLQTIAVNRICTLKKPGKKEENRSIPAATNWHERKSIVALKKQHPGLQVLSRLTVALDEQSQVHQLASDRVQSYDLLAVRPSTDKLFQQSVTSLEVDLISLDLSSRLPFFLRHPQVHKAVERGIFFEIVYSPAIRDNSQRRYVISNALDLVRIAKGRNIIISSEAQGVMDLRGPYDISNLGLLFGLKGDQAKAAVSTNVRAVLFRAEARRGSGKSAIVGQTARSLGPGDAWKVDLAREEQEEESGDDEDDGQPEVKRARPK